MRLVWMTLVGVAAAAGVARADASLAALGGGPVREVAHELDIEIDGLVAEVEVEQTLANGGAEPAEAIYTFELPAGAAVSGLSVRLADGTKTVAAAVDAGAAVRLVAEPDAVDGRPDVGLLRLVAADVGDGPDTYELRVYPIAPGKTVRVSWRYAAAVAARGGRLSLRLPGRGGAENLVRERVRLRVSGRHGAVTAGGRTLGRGGRHELQAPVAGDLVVQVAPTWRGGARAEAAALQLGRSFGVAAVSVAVPESPARPPRRFGRLVLVVDVSRSMGREGLAAAERVAGALRSAVGSGAEVEVVTFDRRAARHGGGELAAGPLENGSDLGAALDLARPGGPALVAVITDGLLPRALGGDEAVRRLGAGPDTAVLGVVLVPDGAPVPPAPEPLAALAAATGGRVVALHHGEVARRAPGLLGELGQEAPLEALTVEAAGAELSGFELPDLAPGSGALALGVYRGSRPPALAVVGRRGSEAIRLEPRRAPRRRAGLLLRLAAAAATPGDWVAGTEAEALGRRRQLAAAAALSVVSQDSALVAVAAGDGFGTGRLELARRYGSAAYRRLPPPPERASGHRFRELDHVDTSARRGHRPTGSLDRSILERLFSQQLVPRARGCYRRTARGERGAVVLTIEIARGEVHAVRAEGGTDRLRACAADAGYAVRVPSVAQGDDPEALVVVRYPLSFQGGGVQAGAARPAGDAAGPDPGDPLGGLPAP